MSNSSQLTAACYLVAIKELLKQRGITYGQLSDALSCSLPTIKRWLNKPTLPLDRLLEIAEVANIQFSEICERAEQLRPQHYIFSDEQDELFAERPEMLDYLQQLIAGKTPAQIAKEFELKESNTTLYLQHLERVGLIKRKGRNQIKLLISPPVGFGPGSRFLKKEMESFLRSIVSDVVFADESLQDRFAILKPLSLTPQDYLALRAGILRLVDQFSAIGESRVETKNTQHWQMAIACGPAPAPQPVTLPRI